MGRERGLRKFVNGEGKADEGDVLVFRDLPTLGDEDMDADDVGL